MMLQEAGHILGLSHPDKIQPLTFSRATATSEAVMYPTGSNHHLSAPCGPNPWALMVPGVPDGAELDPRTGVRPAAMATMQRGNGNRYRCLQPDDLEGLNAFYPPECTGAHAPGVTPTIVCPTFEHEAEFVSSGGTEGDSGSSSMGVIIGGTGEHRPCHPAPARTPPVLPQTYHPADLAPRVACPAHSWRLACALLLLHRHRRRRFLLHEAEEGLLKHQYGDGTCHGAAANRGDRVSAGSTGQAGRSAAKPGCAPCGVRSRAPRTGVRR